MWHCKDTFEERSVCVDGVCAKCRMDDKNIGHSCKKCGQKLDDYKCEENETMMMRKRDNWAGPGQVTCAMCEIVL